MTITAFKALSPGISGQLTRVWGLQKNIPWPQWDQLTQILLIRNKFDWSNICEQKVCFKSRKHTSIHADPEESLCRSVSHTKPAAEPPLPTRSRARGSPAGGQGQPIHSRCIQRRSRGSRAGPRCPLALRVGQGLAVGAAPRLQLRLGDVGQGALDLLEQHIPAVHHLLQPRRRLVVLLLQPVQARSLQSKTRMMPKDFWLFMYFSCIPTSGCYHHIVLVFFLPFPFRTISLTLLMHTWNSV